MPNATLVRFEVEQNCLTISARAANGEIRAIKRDVALERLIQLCEVHRSVIAHRSFVPENDRGALTLIVSLGKQLHELFFAGLEDILEGAESLVLEHNLFLLPLELAHDGNAFLGHRYAVTNSLGRPMLAARHFIPRNLARSRGLPMTCVSVGDEPDSVFDCFGPGKSIRRADKAITPGELRSWLDTKGPYILHFAGHAVFGRENAPELCTLLLQPELGNANLSLRDLQRSWTEPPRLVFLNSCSSEHVGENYQRFVFLADELLRAGVDNCITTLWSITDRPAVQFAAAFYQALVDGHPAADALRVARLQCWLDSESRLTSLSYILFSRPSSIDAESSLLPPSSEP